MQNTEVILARALRGSTTEARPAGAQTIAIAKARRGFRTSSMSTASFVTPASLSIGTKLRGSQSSGATAPPHPRTEMDYSFESRQQELKMGPLPRVPVLVLIAGANRENGVPPAFSLEIRRKMARLGIDLQKEMAAELGGEFIVFDDLSHMMHLEKPTPIIAAVKEMIRKLRAVLAWTT